MTNQTKPNKGIWSYSVCNISFLFLSFLSISTSFFLTTALSREKEEEEEADEEEAGEEEKCGVMIPVLRGTFTVYFTTFLSSHLAVAKQVWLYQF